MNYSFQYIGCFLDPELLQQKLTTLEHQSLHRAIRVPHITFAYRPGAVDRELFGQRIRVVITGYGNNGENEGCLVELHAEHPRLQEMIRGIRIPHVTLSVSPEGKPVNTRYLEFSPVEPIELWGIFGGYTKSGKIITAGERSGK